jgi:NAD(P)-dependent dehydrogenase (short-subunit alcohol dehydrogenase family)
MSCRSTQSFGSSSTAEEVLEGKSLTGKYIIVTGASSGIGEETARVLYNHGANVIMASRNMKALQESEKRIIEQKTSNAGVLYLEVLDLSSLENVDQFVQNYKTKYDKLHILINNAGVMMPPLEYTKDGFESQLATNHLSPFSLTLKLLDLMKTTSEKDNVECRVVNVSSQAYLFAKLDMDDLHFKERAYAPWGCYGQSKLAMIVCSNELNRRLRESGVNITVNSLHPGGIRTNLQRHPYPWYFRTVLFVTKPLFKTIPQGASTQVLVATSSELDGKGGIYFEDCKPKQLNTQASDTSLALKMFQVSEQLTRTNYPLF